MMLSQPLPIWITLAAMALLLSMAVLNTLAWKVRFERTRHDLIRNARLKRQAYLAHMQSLADDGSIEIVDDDEPAMAAGQAPRKAA